MMQYGVRRSADAIGYMTSVERILEYTDLPQESPLVSMKPLPPTWIKEGKIIFRNINLKYKENGPYVLKVSKRLHEYNIWIYSTLHGEKRFE